MQEELYARQWAPKPPKTQEAYSWPKRWKVELLRVFERPSIKFYLLQFWFYSALFTLPGNYNHKSLPMALTDDSRLWHTGRQESELTCEME